MEDRLTPALYLELDGGTPSRVDEVIRWPGIERATWWENCAPDRDDLPRVLPECTTLGLYEASAGFAPPAHAPGFHFRRYPRPGQGVISARPTIGLSVVLISPRRGQDAQALRDWGDFVHIHHIAATANPGMTMITPYEHATGGDPRFLHLYEMDADDPEAVYQAMTPRVAERLGGSFGTPAFDAWAFHPALRIMYVNTFRRLGERPAAVAA